MESNTTEIKLEDRFRRERLRNNLTGSAETLCSFCGNACNNGCIWAEELQPVDGWTAVENKNGFFVVDCPEFRSDDWMRKNSSQLDTEGCIRLLQELISSLRFDYIYYHKSRPVIERFLRNPRYRHLFFFADPEDIIDRFRREMRHTL